MINESWLLVGAESFCKDVVRSTSTMGSLSILIASNWIEGERGEYHNTPTIYLVD
jgi:hypothetical protein